MIWQLGRILEFSGSVSNPNPQFFSHGMFLFLSPFPRLLFRADLTAEWMKQCSWEQSMANTFVTVPDGYGLPEPIQYYGE